MRLISLFVLAFAFSAAPSEVSRSFPTPDEPTYQLKTPGEWITLLRRGGDAQRRSAATALGHFPAETKGLAQALTVATQDKDVIVRREAIRSVGRAGVRTKALVLALGKVLSEENDLESQFFASEALLGLGLEAKEAAPALCVALMNQSKEVRENASTALTRFGASAVPTLCRAVRDRDERLRLPAIQILRDIGACALDGVPTLLKAYDEGDEETRRAIAEAIRKIDPESARKMKVK